MKNSPLLRARPRCSVARTLEIVGERWTLLVLREAFYGQRRFDDLLTGVGCARNILTERLVTLVDEGVLRRVPYQDAGQRPRFEYRLTRKGIELFPIVIALMDWGDRWLQDRSGPPVEVRHRGCGASVHVELRCAKGHGGLGAHDTEPVAARGVRVPKRAAARPLALGRHAPRDTPSE